jgi:MYXO-CTERM domain-containing protein
MFKVQIHAAAAAVSALLIAAGAPAAITGIQATEVDFSAGYVMADGSVDAGSATDVAAAWATFHNAWDTFRLWATVDSSMDIVAAVTGSVDNSIDLIFDPGAAGVFYNNAFGGMTAPSTAALSPFPEVAFDTFITLGAADSSVTPPVIIDLNNDFNGLTGLVQAQNLGYTVTPAAGFGVQPDGQGGFRVLLGQFTIAKGDTFSGQAIVTGGGLSLFDTWSISSGTVPAPGALALLGLAGLAGRRRRRACLLPDRETGSRDLGRFTGLT